MKAKSSQARKKPGARRQTGKVHMPATASGLTSQAGLIPVIKFLQRIGFDKALNQTVPRLSKYAPLPKLCLPCFLAANVVKKSVAFLAHRIGDVFLLPHFQVIMTNLI